jgi:3-hydroxyacyl-CoA dehydrogenase / enoyl-CoA hydratase / 3-hydroxybutyryl-CoA epimerase
LTELIQTQLGADGVLLATIDMPGRAMNVFSLDLMNALDALMDEVDRNDAVRSVVLTSGKSTFLAGADLIMVRGYTECASTASADEMFELCGRLGRQFVRLEASVKPWVAAVNGLAMGGGLELAMACRARLVTDNPRTQISLPEVRWGLLPGAGGTQRMPRLMGFGPAMALLLSGRSLDPAEATRLGLFKRMVGAADLLDQARSLAIELQGQAYDPALKFAHLAQADVPAASAQATREVATLNGVAKSDFDLYPAYGAIIDSVLLGARLPLAQATAVEMRQFLRLMFNPVAGNMVRSLFLNRQRADKEFAAAPELKIESIRIGPLSDAAKDWAASLAACKLVQIADPQLPTDTLALIDNGGRITQFAVRDLAPGPQDEALSSPTAVISRKGPYGRVLEIVGADAQTSERCAKLASHLGALPYRTNAKFDVLASLMGNDGDSLEALDRQSLRAAKLAVEGQIADVELFDVVACAASIAPACSGGPFTHLWQHRDRLFPQLDQGTRLKWPELEPKLQKACA